MTLESQEGVCERDVAPVSIRERLLGLRKQLESDPTILLLIYGVSYIAVDSSAIVYFLGAYALAVLLFPKPAATEERSRPAPALLLGAVLLIVPPLLVPLVRTSLPSILADPVFGYWDRGGQTSREAIIPPLSFLVFMLAVPIGAMASGRLKALTALLTHLTRRHLLFVLLFAVPIGVRSGFRAFQGSNPIEGMAVSQALVLLTYQIAFVAFLEELYFRGLLFTYLQKIASPFVAAAVSSAAFVGLHMKEWQAALSHPSFTTVGALVALFLFGMVLCLVVKRTRSLYPAILMHWTLNTGPLWGSIVALTL
ncbi:MAG: CPBP family intramembrane glutamic endopeptidase [FCB group bacterium]|jgi:membrane protease YdiL (CAAX protease family)|nr:CPBP family intramembrane glutamic endopeptidase [FCB group bacterium]